MNFEPAKGKVYTVNEVMTELRISDKDTAYRHIQEGLLPAVKIGSIYRIVGLPVFVDNYFYYQNEVANTLKVDCRTVRKYFSQDAEAYKSHRIVRYLGWQLNECLEKKRVKPGELEEDDEAPEETE